MATILIVDDEKNMRWALDRALKQEGYETLTAADGLEGLTVAQTEHPDLIVLDLKMPGMDGLSALKKLREWNSQLPVIMITAHGSVETAIEAVKAGAFDYITKPFDVEEIKLVISKALENWALVSEVAFLRSELERKYSFQNIIGKGPKMQALFSLIEKLAETSASVIVYGESGTGKELVARAIHYRSARKGNPYIQVNCAALPETLLESELFGHEKGAFTGAVGRKPGRFELAHNGTIFLDEIGDISLPVQVKLLRVLQEKAFERVGGLETLKIDVRIIAATNQNLAQAIRDGRFREDLYYRLNVVPIHLPPLRERREDIPLLVEHFLKKFDPQGRMRGPNCQAMKLLSEYHWPGNVRELENCLERAVIISSGPEITPADLPPEVAGIVAPGEPRKRFSLPGEGISLEDVEKDLIVQALERSGGNQSRAARLLGITRHTLLYRMEKYGLKA